MPPAWLTIVSWFSLVLAFLYAGVVLFDMFVRGYGQRIWIMEAASPIMAPYFLGPLALLAYGRRGRLQSRKRQEDRGDPPKKSFAASVATGDSHCGAGCTLGDLIGGWAISLLGPKDRGSRAGAGVPRG